MSITLNSKVYNFTGFDKNGVSIFNEVSAGVPTGFSYLTCRVTTPNGTSDSTVRWRLTVPVIATDDSEGVPIGSLLRTMKFEDGKVSLPSTGTAAERDDMQTRITALTATAQYIASIENLVQPTS
jgi:hypothetical protein